MRKLIDISIVPTPYLEALIEGIYQMSVQLEQLSADVEQNTSVTESAITLLENLATELRANANDPAAIQDLADKLETNSSRLADSVAANTPAE